MKELYELKEKLCDELKAYSKREMSSGSLDVIDKLAHAIKNIDKIIENYDGNGYSNYYPNRMNYSMEKDRDMHGRYSSRGEYPYHGEESWNMNK